MMASPRSRSRRFASCGLDPLAASHDEVLSRLEIASDDDGLNDPHGDDVPNHRIVNRIVHTLVVQRVLLVDYKVQFLGIEREGIKRAGGGVGSFLIHPHFILSVCPGLASRDGLNIQ